MGLVHFVFVPMVAVSFFVFSYYSYRRSFKNFKEGKVEFLKHNEFSFFYKIDDPKTFYLKSMSEFAKNTYILFLGLMHGLIFVLALLDFLGFDVPLVTYGPAGI